MDKKILKIKEPLLNCYTIYGALFSIISECMTTWVYNNFIQIRYSKGWNMLSFDNHHMLLSHCPELSFRTIPYNIIKIGYKGDLRKFIVDAINSKQYVFMYVDRFYIPGIPEYQREHTNHEIFIYGYDLEKDIIYIADNLQHGKYITMQCCFSTVVEGYPEYDQKYEFMTDIGLISLNSNIQSSINIEQIIDGLERYLYSKKTFDVRYEQECYFGTCVIERKINYIVNHSEEDIDIRFFHLLYEHKLVMEMRVNYLIEAGWLTAKEINLSHYTELKEQFFILRNMIIKFNLSKKKKLLDEIVKYLEIIAHSDIQLLENLLLILKLKYINVV